MKVRTVMKLATPLIMAGVVLEALNTDLIVRRYQLTSDKLDKDLRIVFLSDLHNNIYGYNQSELIAHIAGEKPDIVLLGGDFIDTVGDHEHSIQLITWLGKHYETYYTTGNHEFNTKKVNQWKKMVRDLNVEVLEGDVLEVPIGAVTVALSGTDDSKQKRLFKKQIHEIGQQINPTQYNILLTHRPDHVDKYTKYPFDLILTGHTHGGQIRLPGLINGLFAPGQGFFPRYGGGEYELSNGSTMIVNRGLMTQYQKSPRIFNRPEVVVVDLLRS